MPNFEQRCVAPLFLLFRTTMSPFELNATLFFKCKALQDAVQEELLLAQRQAEQERAAGQAQLQVTVTADEVMANHLHVVSFFTFSESTLHTYDYWCNYSLQFEIFFIIIIHEHWPLRGANMTTFYSSLGGPILHILRSSLCLGCSWWAHQVHWKGSLAQMRTSQVHNTWVGC